MIEICRNMEYTMDEYDPAILSPLIVLHFITSLSAVLLNLLVLVTICKTKSLQTPSRVFLCSLALSDLLIGLIAQPAAAFFYLSAFNNWLDIHCVFRAIMTQGGYTIGAVSFMTIAAMSVDRCLAVKIKNRYKSSVTKKRALILVVVIWVFSTLAMNLGLLFLDSKQEQYCTFIVTFVLLLVICTSFSLAYFSLRKITVRVSGGSQIKKTNKVGPMQDASPGETQTTSPQLVAIPQEQQTPHPSQTTSHQTPTLHEESQLCQKTLHEPITLQTPHPSQHHTLREPHPSQRRAHISSTFNVFKYKASLNTMLMILLLNLVVYLPLLCFSIIEANIPIPRAHSIVFYQYNGIVMAFNSTLNPVFYLWRMKDLRSALKAFLKRGTATNS